MLLLFVFVHQLVIGVVDDAVVAAEGSRIFSADEALLDLFLHMLRVRQDVEAPIASRAEHFLMIELLAGEHPSKDLFAVDTTPTEVLQSAEQFIDRDAQLMQSLHQRFAGCMHRCVLHASAHGFGFFKYFSQLV
jgi:hypothetical protein